MNFHHIILWKLLIWRFLWYIWGPATCILWAVRFFVTFWEWTGSISWVASLIKITAPEAPMTIAEADSRVAMLDRRRQFMGTPRDHPLTEKTLTPHPPDISQGGWQLWLQLLHLIKTAPCLPYQDTTAPCLPPAMYCVDLIAHLSNSINTYWESSHCSILSQSSHNWGNSILEKNINQSLKI